MSKRGGARARRKGSQGEREAAKVLGGERILQTGIRSADVTDRQGEKWEVKRRYKAFTLIYKFINQNRDMTDGKVIFRDDREEWIVAMPLKTWLKHSNPPK